MIETLPASARQRRASAFHDAPSTLPGPMGTPLAAGGIPLRGAGLAQGRFLAQRVPVRGKRSRATGHEKAHGPR